MLRSTPIAGIMRGDETGRPDARLRVPTASPDAASPLGRRPAIDLVNGDS
jgi:hypothetical protein